MKEIMLQMENFLKARKWDNLRPSDYAKSISIEAAELLEVFQWDPFTKKQLLQDKDRMQRTKEELADILIYCLMMCVTMGIDPKHIIDEKMLSNEKNILLIILLSINISATEQIFIGN